MRKFLCAFILIFSFSLFAQENEESASPDEGYIPGYDVDGNLISDEKPKPTPAEEASRDLSQDYLAKSAAPVNAVAWTRDGKYFATSWNNSIVLWNAGYNTIAAIYSNSVAENANPYADVTSLSFTSDGRYLMSVRDDNTILIHGTDGVGDSTLINGTGSIISDAVYAGDYRILLPLDGKNLYESLKLAESGQHIIEEKLDFADGVWALSASPNGSRVLVTSETGAVHFIDTTNWNEIANYTRYTLTRIKPRLAPDGIHFVAATKPTILSVTSTLDENDNLELEDPAGFSFVAEFSNDSTKIVAGINSGCVKIFDIASGIEENSFKLMYGDSAKSLVFSPDDKYVVIGTEMGYIYHWVLSGEPFVPENQRRETGLQNSLLLSLGFGKIGSNYYIGNGFVEGGYRNYFKPPFFWGVNGTLGVAIPSSEFPYSYYEGGESLSSPSLYTISTGGVGGLVYYNKKYDFMVFSEAGLGINFRMLFNNSFQHAHTSKLVVGWYGEMLVGLQWKWVRAWGGIQYDSNLSWLGKFNLGVAIPTRTFK